MAQLTVDTPRTFKAAVEPIFNDIPMTASVAVYEGSAVGIASGLARQLVAASDEFAGFAEAKADNTSGAASAINAKVRQKGIVTLSVTGASAVTHINDAVYATDGNVFTLTASGGLQIGKVFRWVTGTTCEVFFEALAIRSV